MIIEHLCWYTCTSEEKVGGGQRVAAAYSEETLMSKEKTPNLIVFNHIVFIRVSHITPFFELSYTLLTTHAIGLYEVTKKFQRYRQ